MWCIGAGNQTAACVCARFVHSLLQARRVWRFHSQCCVHGLLTEEAGGGVCVCVCVYQGEGEAESSSSLRVTEA